MGILNQKLIDELLPKVEALAHEKYPTDALGRPLPPPIQGPFFAAHNAFFGRHTLNDCLLQKFYNFIISKAKLNHQEKEFLLRAFQTSLNTAQNSAAFISIFQKSINLYLLDIAPTNITMERGASFKS